MGKPKPQQAAAKTADGNDMKRSREDLDASNEHIESLDDLYSKMQLMFNETNTKIETSKRDLRNEISTLREDVQQLKLDCSSEIKQLSVSVSHIQSNVQLNKERVLAVSKMNDLLLSGVPYIPTENPNDYVRKAALVLGYGDQEVPLVYCKRLCKLPISAGATPPILLQFAFKSLRDEFYRRYLSTRNLTLTHLGLNVNKRIYLNENLTDLSRKIKAEALKLKKSGKLHSVFTRDGFVYVKRTAEEEVQMIFSLDQL